MSWNSIRKSFEGLNNDRFIRKRRIHFEKQSENYLIHISDDEEGAKISPIKSCSTSKKSKLNVIKSKNISRENSQINAKLSYDPDLDDYVGRHTQTSPKDKPLDLFNVRSPLRSKQLSEPQRKSQASKQLSEPQRKSQASRRIVFERGWSPLTANETATRSKNSTFARKIEFKNCFVDKKDKTKDVNILEKSIVECNSDEEQSQQEESPTNLDETIEEICDSGISALRDVDATIVVESSLPSRESSVTSKTILSTTTPGNNDVELNFFIREIQKDLNSTKKLRCKKGGYLESLRRALSNFESDHAFWQHERRCRIIPCGQTGTVEKISKSFGVTLIDLRINGKISTLCWETNKNVKDLQVGSQLEIELSSCSYAINGENVYLACNKIMCK